MRSALIALLLLLAPVSTALTAAELSKPALQLSEVGTSNRSLFQGPSFSKPDALEKQRGFLRKQGFSDAALIEVLARDATDRSWFNETRRAAIVQKPEGA